MMVPEGGSAKLICRAKGFPHPKITWRREDGREIIARNGPHGKTKGKFLTINTATKQFVTLFYTGDNTMFIDIHNEYFD